VTGDRRGRWPDEVRSEALVLYAEEGVHVAHDRTGVPVNTIRSWAKRASAFVEERTGVEVVPQSSSGVPWSERREVVVDQIGGLVALAISKTREAFEAGRLRDAKDGTISLAVLIDKAQLLTGSATSRSESLSLHGSVEDVQQKIDALEAELGYR